MNSTSDAADNKRAYIRLKLNSKVRLQTDHGAVEHEGRCIDMSGSGLMIVSDAPFAVGDSVVARIESKGTDIIYNTTVKRVVEAEDAPDGERKLAMAIDEILD